MRTRIHASASPRETIVQTFCGTMQAAQRSTRLMASAISRQHGAQVRQMSSHGTPEENAKWMKLWTYTTFAAFPVLIGFGYYCMSHEHDHHAQPKYPYLKRREKKFPWGSDCDLFDMRCAQGHH
jgi:hypothetical protein